MTEKPMTFEEKLSALIYIFSSAYGAAEFKNEQRFFLQLDLAKKLFTKEDFDGNNN